MILKRILRFTSLFFFFVICTLIFVYFTLPTEEISHFISQRIEKELGYKYDVQIEDVTLLPVAKARLSDIRVDRLGQAPLDPKLAVNEEVYGKIFCPAQVGNEPIYVESIDVVPSLFSLIRKKVDADIELEIAGGSVEAHVAQNKGNFAFKSLKLAQLTLLSNLTRVPVNGDLSATFSTSFVPSGKSFRLRDTQVDMQIEDVSICPARIATKTPSLPFFELPFTVLGDIKFIAKLDNAQDILRIETLTASGPDIAFEATGDILLKTPQRREIELDVEITIRPSAEWLKANSMGIIYKICKKYPDDSIILQLSGSLAHLRKDCGKPNLEDSALAAPESDVTEQKDEAEGEVEKKGDDVKKKLKQVKKESKAVQEEDEVVQKAPAMTDLERRRKGPAANHAGVVQAPPAKALRAVDSEPVLGGGRLKSYTKDRRFKELLNDPEVLKQVESEFEQNKDILEKYDGSVDPRARHLKIYDPAPPTRKTRR